MRPVAVMALALSTPGCQAAGKATAPPSASAATSEIAAFYKYAGSRQCVGGGISAEDARRSLVAAGVEVVEAGCGSDGRMRTAVCGSADGRLVIVRAPARQAAVARSQGFAPLEQIPGAVPQPCR